MRLQGDVTDGKRSWTIGDSNDSGRQSYESVEFLLGDVLIFRSSCTSMSTYVYFMMM